MKYLSAILLFFLYALLIPQRVLAVENPLSMPNNKFGIHILFPSELKDAATLINSTGGDWGYVTIPIQSGDRDIEKWQRFMDDARKNHIIPIIRLATEGDYFNTQVWRKPTAADILDFANFLNSLNWPTKNRYVVVFNEVNRGDEWGGTTDPADYAQILSYAVSVFKSKSDDFFIISAGLDNAAPTQPPSYMNEYTYMNLMDQEVPGIFNQIDGMASHAYPNPGFSTAPTLNNSQSISSFTFERTLASSLSSKTLPVFITETGWAGSIADDQKATWYQTAFSNSWSDSDIVAITPFILRAGGEPFKKFSFLKEDGSKTLQYIAYQQIPKVKGTPTLTKPVPAILGTETTVAPDSSLVFRNFSMTDKGKKKSFSNVDLLESTFKWMMKL